MLTKNPNAAHMAIAGCEERLRQQGREVTVITQNIDELHRRAGSKNILEIHGMWTESLTKYDLNYQMNVLWLENKATLLQLNVNEWWVVFRGAVWLPRLVSPCITDFQYEWRVNE